MKKPASRTQPAAPSDEPVEPLAKIEAMILELDELRSRERDASIVGAYRAAAPEREPPPEPPQRPLSLGPVIVEARRPKRK